jgi:hypothetical protein
MRLEDKIQVFRSEFLNQVQNEAASSIVEAANRNLSALVEEIDNISKYIHATTFNTTYPPTYRNGKQLKVSSEDQRTLRKFFWDLENDVQHAKYASEEKKEKDENAELDEVGLTFTALKKRNNKLKDPFTTSMRASSTKGMGMLGAPEPFQTQNSTENVDYGYEWGLRFRDRNEGREGKLETQDNGNILVTPFEWAWTTDPFEVAMTANQQSNNINLLKALLGVNPGNANTKKDDQGVKEKAPPEQVPPPPPAAPDEPPPPAPSEPVAPPQKKAQTGGRLPVRAKAWLEASGYAGEGKPLICELSYDQRKGPSFQFLNVSYRLEGFNNEEHTKEAGGITAGNISGKQPSEADKLKANREVVLAEALKNNVTLYGSKNTPKVPNMKNKQFQLRERGTTDEGSLSTVNQRWEKGKKLASNDYRNIEFSKTVDDGSELLTKEVCEKILELLKYSELTGVQKAPQAAPVQAPQAAPAPAKLAPAAAKALKAEGDTLAGGKDGAGNDDAVDASSPEALERARANKGR